MIRDEILKYLDELLVVDDDNYEDKGTVIKQNGTFFFLYIDPSCDVFGVEEENFEDLVVQLEFEILKRFIDSFLLHCSKSMPRYLISGVSDLVVRTKPNDGFDNGEVYLWLDKLKFKREFVVRVLMSLVDLLEANPIKFTSEQGSDIEIRFFGWGFGYL